jgi:hypothetical protein
LLLIWIMWLAASSLCLALDRHSCCPTEKADWHMDTIQVSPKVESDIELETTKAASCEVDDPDCQETPDCFKHEVEQHLPPPSSLLIRSTFHTLAPPKA